MFRKPTVLVLGAGASAPFGFPLGPKLLENIVRGIEALENRRLVANDFREAKFSGNPYLALRQAIYQRQVSFFAHDFAWKGVLELKADLLSSQRTVDEFARINPRWREILKYFICLEIAKATLVASSERANTYLISNKILRRSSDSWYAALVNWLRDGAQNADDLASNKLAVITFNYDRSLEHFFEAELGKGQIFSGFDMNSAPKIVHVHGEIRLPIGPGNPSFNIWESIEENAERFLMLGETRDGMDVALLNAKNSLKDAERIFVLGSDLHEENSRILGMDHESIAQKCIVLNWDDSMRVKHRAEELGVLNGNILSRPGSQLEIAAAIADGLFYRRPQ